MVRTARELLEDTAEKLAPDPRANRLLPLIARGAAQRSTLAALALEQRHVMAADRRAFLHLAERPDVEPQSAAFFAMLAEGEALALGRLEVFAAACGVDEARAAAYEPLADCQAYPAYVAWLALNGSPADVVLALSGNFTTWGGYCAAIAESLRRHYGFGGEVCGFFDFFAAPAPELERKALTAVQAGLDAGRIGETEVLRYGRLLQSYEAKFWHALWELDQRTT